MLLLFGLQDHDIGSLQDFGALLHGELDALPFTQVLVALTLDGCVLDEHVLSALVCYETIAS